MIGGQLRIAWTGPAPADTGGSLSLAAAVVRGLAEAGAIVECFVEQSTPCLKDLAQESLNVRVHEAERINWQWDRWYSRTPLAQLVSGQATRYLTQRRIVERLRAEHQRNPFDFLYQFSQIESPVRGRRQALPPVVVHPGVHAAGELRWHRAESSLARQCERRAWHLAVRSMLTVRAAIQRRDIAKASSVIAMSSRFGQLLAQDYGVDPQRVAVVPNGIDLDRFSPDGGLPPDKTVLLFLSRHSVRKGLEMVVELSRRLDDLAGTVTIRTVGSRSQWSNYTCLRAGANHNVLEAEDGIPHGEVPALLRSSAALLQPSRYEPFGLTVAEALASGTVVVASDQVGAAEGLDRRACRVFPDGDMDAFEETVRTVVQRTSEERAADRIIARREAERCFAMSEMGRRIHDHLVDVRDRLAAVGP